MADESRFAVYFSHSWHPRDVELNVQIWTELAPDCALLVDRPEVAGAGTKPPYYINRIEELLRSTDLFVSVLTYREPGAEGTEPAGQSMYCSPYSLFEIQLAERADIPRLILYERGTRFSPPSTVRDSESYIEFNRGVGKRFIEQHRWTTVIRAKIQQWKAWAVNHRRPVSYERSKTAAILAGPTVYNEISGVLRGALQACEYEPIRCDPTRQESSDIFRLLPQSGLVLAEFGIRDSGIEQVYAAAHVLGLPAIRMLCSPSKPVTPPWILKGGPGGFEEDIVVWNKPDDLLVLVEPRIAAMNGDTAGLRDDDSFDYLQSKRYADFYVFISHRLRGSDRVLVDEIVSQLKNWYVISFEYQDVNTAGSDWKKALAESLINATHFVALLDPTYEQSEYCEYELDEILKRESEVTILPFMILGRDTPNPHLKQIHNRLVSNEVPSNNAKVVVRQIMADLDEALIRSWQD